MSANPLIAGPVDTATGIGWVLDHVEPLKSSLNDLPGNAVTAYLGKKPPRHPRRPFGFKATARGIFRRYQQTGEWPQNGYIAS